MNIATLVGAFVGVFVGIVIVALLLKFTKTDKSNKCKYDERQQLVRGKGYQWGFFSMMAISVLSIVLEMGEMALPVEDSVVHFVSIIVGVGVYAGYCIMKDSYFALNENKKTVLIIFGVVGIINLSNGIVRIMDGSMMENGVVNYNCINFLCGILFVAIFILLLIKGMLDKREDD